MSETPTRRDRSGALDDPLFELADAKALQAVAKGEANADQQKRAIAWIINQGCRTNLCSFHPGGQEGDRATAFAEGRRLPGRHILVLVNTNIETLKKLPNYIQGGPNG